MNDFVVWLIELLRQYNLLVLALLLVLQTNGIPVGANFLVIASGAFTFLNGSSLVTIGLEVWLFAVLGDTISYWIWRKAGPSLIIRFPRVGSRAQQGISKMEGYFSRFGSTTVLLTRFPLSALGPLVNISAGVTGYRFVVYASWALVGEFMWTSFNLGMGYWFGDSFELLVPIITQFGQLILLAAGIISLGYFLINNYRKKRKSS